MLNLTKAVSRLINRQARLRIRVNKSASRLRRTCPDLLKNLRLSSVRACNSSIRSNVKVIRFTYPCFVAYLVGLHDDDC